MIVDDESLVARQRRSDMIKTVILIHFTLSVTVLLAMSRVPNGSETLGQTLLGLLWACQPLVLALLYSPLPRSFAAFLIIVPTLALCWSWFMGFIIAQLFARRSGSRPA